MHKTILILLLSSSLACVAQTPEDIPPPPPIFSARDFKPAAISEFSSVAKLNKDEFTGFKKVILKKDNELIDTISLDLYKKQPFKPFAKHWICDSLFHGKIPACAANLMKLTESLSPQVFEEFDPAHRAYITVETERIRVAVPVPGSINSAVTYFYFNRDGLLSARITYLQRPAEKDSILCSKYYFDYEHQQLVLERDTIYRNIESGDPREISSLSETSYNQAGLPVNYHAKIYTDVVLYQELLLENIYDPVTPGQLNKTTFNSYYAGTAVVSSQTSYAYDKNQRISQYELKQNHVVYTSFVAYGKDSISISQTRDGEATGAFTYELLK
jgi:hypothetical protein